MNGVVLIETTLAQVYIVLFSSMAFAGVALVGIITPLLTRVITDLEMLKFKEWR
jgi:hypothetical protein